MAGDTAAVETLLQLCIRSIAFRWSDFDSASLQTLPLELQQTILERVTPINVTDEQLPYRRYAPYAPPTCTTDNYGCTNCCRAYLETALAGAAPSEASALTLRNCWYGIACMPGVDLEAAPHAQEGLVRRDQDDRCLVPEPHFG